VAGGSADAVLGAAGVDLVHRLGHFDGIFPGDCAEGSLSERGLENGVEIDYILALRLKGQVIMDLYRIIVLRQGIYSGVGDRQVGTVGISYGLKEFFIPVLFIAVLVIPAALLLHLDDVGAPEATEFALAVIDFSAAAERGPA